MNDPCKDADKVSSLPVVGQGDLFMLPELAAVSPTHHPGTGLVFTEHCLHGISYFPDRTSEEKQTANTQMHIPCERELKRKTPHRSPHGGCV